MPPTNQLRRALAPLHRVPASIRPWARSLALGRVVPFVGTAGLVAERLDDAGAVFTLANKRRVQNHIRGVHAAATALLAETASGLCFGWHLPDGKLPLLKAMKIDYVARAQGDLRAEAHLEPDQIAMMQAEERGAVDVAVKVTDEASAEPVRCTMTWAWVTKKA